MKNTNIVASEQIAEWKEKHGEVFKITVEDKACYIKRPSRKALGYASVGGKDNPIVFSEIILKDCWLGGDKEIQTDDALFLAASAKVVETIKVAEAALEKL